MNRTITALFDSRDDADQAKRKLNDAGVSDVQVTSQGAGYGDETLGQTTTPAGLTGTPDSVRDVSEGDYGQDQNRNRGSGGGLWGSIKNLFSDDDRSTYEEGLRRGHFLLTAQVDDTRTDEAVRILEGSNAVDVDQRAEEWKAGGWTGSRSPDDKMQGIVGEDTLHHTSGDDQLHRGEPDTLRGDSDQRLQADTLRGDGDRPLQADTLRGDNDERIEIVEERLSVGKREVDRGGVRVRSYVRETPVNEQVTLHKEHVDVERRPVDRAMSAADLSREDLFKERTIEMSERSEEAVVAKEARVVEEVLLRKDVEDRTETISDSVRKTQVDVERLDGSGLAGENRAFTARDDNDVIPGETDEERRMRLARMSGTPGTTSTV